MTVGNSRAPSLPELTGTPVRQRYTMSRALASFVRHMLATETPHSISDDEIANRWLTFADSLVKSGVVKQADRDRWSNPFRRARHRRR